MELSDEQMSAITMGCNTEKWWRWYELPVGPKELPNWIKDARVKWRDGYSNSPDLFLKVSEDVKSWNRVFTSKDGVYSAVHPDGRMVKFHHDGRVGIRDVRVFQRPDGTIHQGRRQDFSAYGGDFGFEPG